ncbi:hypothetical protein DIE02_33875 [Burkholderia sp. Bp8991]|nr:hypothetical protein DIE02_33875 [Burkholderia sp. Bp8991]
MRQASGAARLRARLREKDAAMLAARPGGRYGRSVRLSVSRSTPIEPPIRDRPRLSTRRTPSPQAARRKPHAARQPPRHARSVRA